MKVKYLKRTKLIRLVQQKGDKLYFSLLERTNCNKLAFIEINNAITFGNHLSSRQEIHNHKFRAPAKKQFSYETQEKIEHYFN